MQDKRKIQIWDLCDESSVAVAARVLEGVKSVKPGKALTQSLQQNASPVRRANIPQGRETVPVSPVSFSKSIRAQFWQDGLTRSEGLNSGTFSDTKSLAPSAKGACLSYSPQSEAGGNLLARMLLLAFGQQLTVRMSEREHRCI